MKRRDLLRRLAAAGCERVRHGGRHDWYRNPSTGVCQPIPRHAEVQEQLARHFLRLLDAN